MFSPPAPHGICPTLLRSHFAGREKKRASTRYPPPSGPRSRAGVESQPILVQAVLAPLLVLPIRDPPSPSRAASIRWPHPLPDNPADSTTAVRNFCLLARLRKH